jgi:hypothetical protein
MKHHEPANLAQALYQTLPFDIGHIKYEPSVGRVPLSGPVGRALYGGTAIGTAILIAPKEQGYCLYVYNETIDQLP